MKPRDWVCTRGGLIILFACRDFDGDGGDLEIVFEWGGSVGGVKAMMLTTSVEVTEVVNMKIGSIDNVVNEAINLALRL